MLSHITSRTYHLDDVTRVYRQLHRSLASDGHIFDRFKMDVKPEHMNLIHVLLILFNFSYDVLSYFKHQRQEEKHHKVS